MKGKMGSGARKVDMVHTAEILIAAELDKIKREKLLRKNEEDRGPGLGWVSAAGGG